MPVQPTARAAPANGAHRLGTAAVLPLGGCQPLRGLRRLELLLAPRATRRPTAAPRGRAPATAATALCPSLRPVWPWLLPAAGRPHAPAAARLLRLLQLLLLDEPSERGRPGPATAPVVGMLLRLLLRLLLPLLLLL